MKTLMHLVYSFDVGGLENVIVQLINRLPPDRYRHVLVSLTTLGAFADRITAPGVDKIALHKGPGHAIPLYPQLFRLFRQHRPAVLHTCNLAALEVVPIAWAAGVPQRVHAEHGWDASDPNGLNPRYQRLRRLYKPFVSHYVTVSKDLDDYLAQRVGVPPSRHTLIANGVDTDVFSPGPTGVGALADCPFNPADHWLVGTVGRLQTVKNQPLLARAFVRFLETNPQARTKARLVMVGEGPLRDEVEAVLTQAGVSHLAWLPGARADVPQVLQALDVFVLPSQTEGTSCTLQEAMACGLPSVCTAVGGTPDVVSDGVDGVLVPPGDADAMAQALGQYWAGGAVFDAATQHGRAARAKALQRFGIDAMLTRYDAVFGARF